MTLLSICIPTYNRLRYLTELIESLLPQVDALPAGTVELCVSDNVSTDGTRNYLATLKSSSLRFWTNETNIGGDRNFLKCVSEARGEYVWLLGDDELVPPRAIERVVEFLTQHRPGLLISVGAECQTPCANYPTYAAAISGRPLRFPLVHTLISANVFKRSRFDLDFAAAHLYLSYAHMFGMMCNLPGEPIGLLPSFVTVRPIRAEFAKYPSFLCVKQAIYLWWLIRKFNLPNRYRLYAIRMAANLPLEFVSRIKNWLLRHCR